MRWRLPHSSLAHLTMTTPLWYADLLNERIARVSVPPHPPQLRQTHCRWVACPATAALRGVERQHNVVIGAHERASSDQEDDAARAVVSSGDRRREACRAAEGAAPTAFVAGEHEPQPRLRLTAERAGRTSTRH